MAQQISLAEEKEPRRAQAIADYIEGPIEHSGKSVGEIARLIGYRNQNNLSMAKKGSVVLPMNKVEALAKNVHGLDKFKLATLVFKTWDKERYDILQRCGVVVDEGDRAILDTIKDRIPVGDIDSEFMEKLEEFLNNY